MGSARDYIYLMRPWQWYKNLLVFIGMVFSMHAFEFIYYPPLIVGFLSFSLLSSTSYILNDIEDIEDDKVHPEKRKRPLPSGKISIRSAKIFAVFTFIAGMFLGYVLSLAFFLILILYFITSQIYNHYLENVAIIDVVTIGIGFVWRAIGGCVLASIPFTSWLVIGVFFVALLLGFSKRKNEMLLLKDEAAAHKKVMRKYNHNILDHAISMSGAMIILYYTLYCESVQQRLIITIPIVASLVLRYMYLVFIGHPAGRKPHKALTDKTMLYGGIIFIISVTMLFYFWAEIMGFLTWLSTFFPEIKVSFDFLNPP